jgi:cobalt-zinc-cadmium efflux system protein
MSHSCSHHHHVPTSFHKAFGIGIALNILIVLLEAVGGLYAGSLSLLADAVHNLGDVLGLVLAWLGYHLAQAKPSARFTFGLGRFSIFATVMNGLLLIGSSLWIIIEALQRWQHPHLPETGIVVVVALVGIIVNIGTALALQRGQADINIKGAFIHMLGDAGISASVVVSALVMHFFGVAWLDPALSVILALFILWTSWPILFEGLRLSMDGVPNTINSQLIQEFILSEPPVTAVNDLRIWAISTTKTALSAHVTIPPDQPAMAVLRHLQQRLKHEFPLEAVTLQLESDHSVCISDH